MATLPTDMITRILSRLPVKKLVSFTCVSKPWSSLIHDSDFAKLHLHHSFKTNANLKLVLESRTEDDQYKAYSVDFDSLGNLEELTRPYSDAKGFVSSRIFGSCNGLLAVWHDTLGIALWNPSTRACHYLPKLIFGDEWTNSYILGFGYDIVGNDYKVVQMLDSGKTVMIYSLKAKSWRKIKDCPYQISYNAIEDGVYANGSVHWVGDEKDKHYGGRLIFGLDLGTEEFHQVPEPDISKRNFVYKCVGVLGGSLSVFRDYHEEDHVNLWVMKEYGAKESWSELVHLSREREEWWEPCMLGTYTRAIAYSKKGDRVLLGDGVWPRQPAWYNLEKKTKETFDIPGAPEHFTARIYEESLVSVSANSSLI